MSLSHVNRKEAEFTFHTCDDGNKGFLDKEDYKTAVISLFGLMPTDSEIDEVFVAGKEQKEEDGLSLRKDKFINLMVWRSGSALNCYNYERLLFDCFDPLQDGFIKIEDFEKIVQKYFPKVIQYNIQRHI
ncbi:EF-hand calcium-binding domain-containing protein 11-like isoform X1 [Oopsacas minuta]|uniref:EF-hand calcium-binding domain-containing protein 11-like isoform X1 n=1 Tax=Oopsacas minuta TaxID=111878 RepID=A0AAV7K0H2_9METZ|nr:EF-hand calcium-binding domain-containing protein 11-like isoform X1 [Oopsacas minuta]